MCRNAAPSSRQYSPSTATRTGTRSSWLNSRDAMFCVKPPAEVSAVTR